MDGVKQDALSVQTVADNNIPWQERLSNILQYPALDAVIVFQNSIVRSALEGFSEELAKRGVRSSVISTEQDSVWLEVFHGEELDFVYKVRANESEMSNEALVPSIETLPADNKYWRSEVHLTEGGQDYDVMGWSRDQVINDVLGQYERHLNFLNSTR